MERYSIPAIYCPFPPLINAHVEEVQEHITTWVQHFHLVRQERALQRFRASKFGYLISRAYPRAAFQDLAIVADWNTWLFLLDDQFDESGIGRDPEQMQQAFADLLAILHDALPQAGDSPLALSLHDVWQRMQQRTTAAWQESFRTPVEDYFAACIWEATNRARKLTPRREEYIRLRRITGALLTDVALIDLTEHIALPPAVRLSAPVEQLTDMANDVVCWTNDIISLEKEMARGDVHNLVLVIQHEQQCSLQAAVDEAAQLVRARVEEYIATERDLPSFGPASDADLAKYRAVLRAWMRGNLDWGRDSGRYVQIEEAAQVSYLEPLLDSASHVAVAATEPSWWQRLLGLRAKVAPAHGGKG